MLIRFFVALGALSVAIYALIRSSRLEEEMRFHEYQLANSAASAGRQQN